MHSLLIATTSVAGENEVHLLGATPRGLRQEWLGTYERQPDGVDGCTPAYKRKGPKADKDEKFLWFHKQSTSWFVGRRRALRRGAGLISVLDPTKGAAAPEAVAATWSGSDGFMSRDPELFPGVLWEDQCMQCGWGTAFRCPHAPARLRAGEHQRHQV